MSHWPYIVAAYALTLGGMGVLMLVSWLRVRGAESQVDALQTPLVSSEVEKRVSARSEQGFSTALEANGDKFVRSPDGEGAVGPA
jgi:hypothetical protein